MHAFGPSLAVVQILLEAEYIISDGQVSYMTMEQGNFIMSYWPWANVTIKN